MVLATYYVALERDGATDIGPCMIISVNSTLRSKM